MERFISNTSVKVELRLEEELLESSNAILTKSSLNQICKNLRKNCSKNHVGESSEEENCPVETEKVEEMKEVVGVGISNVETNSPCRKVELSNLR